MEITCSNYVTVTYDLTVNDSLESVERSDESKSDDDYKSWIDLNDEGESREFEEPRVFETNPHEEGQRLDLGRGRNSKFL